MDTDYVHAWPVFKNRNSKFGDAYCILRKSTTSISISSSSIIGCVDSFKKIQNHLWQSSKSIEKFKNHSINRKSIHIQYNPKSNTFAAEVSGNYRRQLATTTRGTNGERSNGDEWQQHDAESESNARRSRSQWKHDANESRLVLELLLLLLHVGAKSNATAAAAGRGNTFNYCFSILHIGSQTD